MMRATTAILALALLPSGCAPTLQVARWQDARGGYAVTVRCTAGGAMAEAELAMDTTPTVRPVTPAVP